MNVFRILLLGSLFGSVASLAWDRHDLITEFAVAKYSFKEVNAIYQPLTKALKNARLSLSARDEAGLLRELKLNKTFAFERKLGESEGSGVPVNLVLSKYADEPDWGADKDLFSPDQYPALWHTDLAYVGKRSGEGSTGFRHMFFPGRMDWSQPISSFQIPMRPLGEAPKRAALFFKLAKEFFNSGDTYWGYRFLAWSFHYVEDLFQPYHSRQCPSKSFMRFKLKWLLVPDLDVSRTANQIEYYHLSFERWLARKEYSNLKGFLLGAEVGPEIQGLEGFLEGSVVDFSSQYAADVAELNQRLFAPLPPKTQASPSEIVGSEVWEKGIQSGNHEAKLEKISGKIFSQMGKVLRRLLADSH